LPEGRGRWVASLEAGTTYEGEFKAGELSGEGTLTKAGGVVFTGSFAEGRPHGQGKLTKPDGEVFEGSYERNKRCGQGTLRYADGKVYSGGWAANKCHGEGTLTSADGSVAYAGPWVDGTPTDPSARKSLEAAAAQLEAPVAATQLGAAAASGSDVTPLMAKIQFIVERNNPANVAKISHFFQK